MENKKKKKMLLFQFIARFGFEIFVDKEDLKEIAAQVIKGPFVFRIRGHFNLTI